MLEEKHAVFYFDKSCVMAKPWAKAGYICWCIDIQHNEGVEIEGNIRKVYHDLSSPWFPPCDRSDIQFFFAFPPCTDVAVSGARWFKEKGLRALSKAISFFATCQEFSKWLPRGVPYGIENPVSTISSYCRKPDHTFHPSDYTGFCLEDNYTKKTCIWSGGEFKMPKSFMKEGIGDPDDRIHKCAPGPSRANIRSKTPYGFAKAVFETNKRD